MIVRVIKQYLDKMTILGFSAAFLKVCLSYTNMITFSTDVDDLCYRLDSQK